MIADVPLVVFDAEELTRRTGGDAALRAELIGMFAEDCPIYIATIQRALASGDGEAVRRAAHTLKGAAACLGGRALASEAAQLEALGRQGHLAEAAENLIRLEAAVAAFLPLLA